MLDNVLNTSYAEEELTNAKEATEKFIVKSIIDHKEVGRIDYFKVWWKGYKKEDATWEPRSKLIKDVPDLINEYLNK